MYPRDPSERVATFSESGTSGPVELIEQTAPDGRSPGFTGSFGNRRQDA
ncbi:hypothetical protein [Caudoviricetes sp.]|nr:hypothetical protein [Caudoviricetes sp.]UOF81872.1 hypothetical protein [Caudoviricetes sp.]